MIGVYYTHVETENIGFPGLEGRLQPLLAELPLAKREQVSRLRPLQGRFNSIVGWHLVKFAFRCAGYPDFQLSRLQFMDKQKPRWPESRHDFNLAHSQSMLICAITDNGLVGVDTEFIRPLDSRRMFEQIRAEDEVVSDVEDNGLFFRYWTGKEAVIKAEGNGGIWNARNVRLHNTTATYKNSDWHLYPLNPVSGYATCVASNLPEQPIQTQAVAIEQLLEPEWLRI